MEGFSEPQRQEAKKPFRGVSVKKGEPKEDFLVTHTYVFLDGLTQLLLEHEITILEHRQVLAEGLSLDACYYGFTKLARDNFAPTDYLTAENLMELRILMCRLAYSNPGRLFEVSQSLMRSTVEARLWAGCIRSVGSLYANSPPPAKGSLKDGNIKNYLITGTPKTPQGVTPPLVKRSVVLQTPSPLTPGMASPATASTATPSSVAKLPSSAAKLPPAKPALKQPPPEPRQLILPPRILARNHYFRVQLRLATEVNPGQLPTVVLMAVLQGLLIYYRMIDSLTVMGTWNEAANKSDLTPEEFPVGAAEFAPYVDRLIVPMGNKFTYVKVRFKCNQLPNFFTSDMKSLSKSWFDQTKSSGYRLVCQTWHDTEVVGWFLMSGPHTDHVFLENSIREGMVPYLPAGKTIHFGCFPKYQHACKPNEGDTLETHPGCAKAGYGGYPAYRPISVECETGEAYTLQGIIRKLFNVHVDPWMRLKHYDIFLLPPAGSSNSGSQGAKLRQKKLHAHVSVVFSLFAFTTSLFQDLDLEIEKDGKWHTARGVLLALPWPIHDRYELQDERNPTATVDPETGKTPKRLYHSVDYKRDQVELAHEMDHGNYTVTAFNDRCELAEAFLRVFPKVVERLISVEASKLWFKPQALAAAEDQVLIVDDEGNWTGEWRTAADGEDWAMLHDKNLDVDTSTLPPPDNSTRPMHATSDDLSVRTFGTVFGRGVEPVAEEATALPVDSVSPVGLSGAAAPEGGGLSD